MTPQTRAPQTRTAQTGRRLHDITLTVSLRAPWLVHGNDPGRLGLDAVQLRAPDGQRRLLPGTLLAGRIRDAWQVLKADFHITDIPSGDAWFGPPSHAYETEDAEAVAQQQVPRRRPQRARIFTTDLVECGDSSANLLILTRVKIDSDSGAGSDGMLLAVEQRERPGSSIFFTGTWRAWLADDEPQALQAHLLKALLWQTQLGAGRSFGFGELLATGTSVQVTPAAAHTAAETPGAATPQQAFADAHPGPGQPRGLRLHFDQPLAIANRHINGNLFQSDDFLPGAAIKGAMAHAWDQCQPGRAKPAWFDALRVTHAVPTSGAERPMPLPYSLVAGLGADQADASKLIWDLSLADGDPSHLLDAHHRSVSFEPDWKQTVRDQAQARQQRGAVERYLRVRTAIEAGQAKHGSLFAYDCVVSPHLAPPGPRGPKPETHWAATLDLPPPFDTAQNWAEIAALLTTAPLGPLGKTDAFARVELQPNLAPVWPINLDLSNTAAAVRLVLASPALLFASSDVAGNTSTAPTNLQAVYAQAFESIAAATVPAAGTGAGDSPALELQRFYARQRLAGGEYLAHRFRRSGPPKPYLPYVLTEAGSVFIFKVKDPMRAKELLMHWQQHGLPLSHAVTDEHGGDWTSNPWLPQNGYGEVAVNPCTGFAASLLAAQDQVRQPSPIPQAQ